MLVCPNCQSENPNTNNFCQKCGTSLRYKNCHNCHKEVKWSDENCPHCGTFTGTVRWAIISQPSTEVSSTKEENVAQSSVTEEIDLKVVPENSVAGTGRPITVLKVDEEEEETDEVDDSSDLVTTKVEDEIQAVEEKVEISPTEEREINQQPVYLDSQQRYRVLNKIEEVKAWFAGQPALDKFLQLKVLDENPLEKSLLDVVLEQNADPSELLEGHESQLASELLPKMGLNELAVPYILLQNSFVHIVPEVHDAWQDEQGTVVLLEDRSEWELVASVWGREDLPILQILFWLDEMACLWKALLEVGCGESLLVEKNLRVDEDQNLGLQQLYFDARDRQGNLQDLGKMWQKLFHQSGKTQYGPLVTVLKQLSEGELSTVEELRTKIAAIARQEQEVDFEPDEVTDELEDPEWVLDEEDLELENLAEQDEQMDSEHLFYNSPDNDTPTVVLPMQLLSLDDAGCTDIGRQRQHNEDYFGITTQLKKHENVLGKSMEARGLYIVCDGMGGHAAGEVASAMAVETLQRYFEANWVEGKDLPEREVILQGILAANQAIYDVNQQNARSGSGRMGTTLVMALIKDTNVAIAHVGDSRIYTYTRKRGLEQITIDHEVGQREIERGVEPEIAYSRPDAYQLTQALGPRDSNVLKPDITFTEVNEDTLFILCSDGLSDNQLLENNWESYIAPLISSKANLEQGLLKLIEFANHHNGHDNITVAIAKLKVRPNLEHQRL
ncbi:MAG: serine/threonine phosphatase [Oscillatoria sp. PMC 1051.18]|nr:serine/threonine phosphatase [Oscillatoria sp. PMC 1050.18]MEC5028721.1 serine/threonine phosphatase [Oscillatoria sp. PMC 1051.18]